LPSSSAVRRLTILIPASLGALLVLLLAAPGRVGARTPGHRCASVAHAVRAQRACAHARGRRGHAEHQHPAARRRHARHAATRKRAGKRAKSRPIAQTPPAATRPQPSCEDGSKPVSLRDGSFACTDGSEPTCENGAEPAGGSSALSCPAAPGAGAGPQPAVCEDDSAPLRADDRSFSCGDESEPECEDSSAPVLSGDGSTLLCDPAAETGPFPTPGSFDSTG
jgi:hypothetical protein